MKNYGGGSSLGIETSTIGWTGLIRRILEGTSGVVSIHPFEKIQTVLKQEPK